MKGKLLLIIKVLFVLGVAISFTILEAAPAKTTWSWTSPEEGSILFSVKETSDGGYIAVGNARSGPGKPHGVYLVKFNKDGIKVWDKWWGDTEADGIYSIGYDVIESDDRGYVLTGKIVPPSKYFDRLLVMKVDSKGTPVWQKLIASPLGQGHYGECGFAIQKTPDTGYIVAGYIQNKYKVPLRDETVAFLPYVLKLDNNGNILWEKYYGDYLRTEEKKVNTLDDGSYSREYEVKFVRAKTGGYFFAFTIALDYEYHKYDRKMIKLLRLDEKGNVIWEKSIHHEIGSDMFVAGISATTDDGVAITGFTNTKNLKKQGEWAVGFLAKFDSKGNWQWKRYFGNSQYTNPDDTTGIVAKPNSIQQTSDSGYIVSGYLENNGIVIVKFDGDGNVMWDRVIVAQENYAYCTRQTSDGGYITAGAKFKPRFKTYSALAYLLKFDRAGNMSVKYTSGRIKNLE